MNSSAKITLLILLAVWSAGHRAIYAHCQADSLLQLPEVIVTAKASREIIPAQKLSGEELKELSSLSVADAIRYFSGVQIKDYGGIGGLKTVDIRSMGTNHMGVFYDGIQLGNAQNGQIDLGKFSLDHIESITLYNGQKSEIFQPAKDFGSSGSIYLRTRYPRFKTGQQHHLKGVVRTGSFGLLNPSLLWEQKIATDLAGSFNAEWVHADGKYAYRYKRVHPITKETVYDTTAIRQNGDVDAWRLEAALHGFVPGGNWNLKSYFYTSERGIPGAIVNNVWKRAQRQWDRNFFTQGSFQKTVSSQYDLLISGKYANDHMRYLNPDTTLIYIDNSFTQQEAYLSLVNKYQLRRNWDVSLAADFQWNGLRSNLDGFVQPSRYTYLVAAATAVDFGKVSLLGSLLGTFIHEQTRIEHPATQNNPNRQRLTPSLFVTYKPYAQHDLHFRAFYKHIFRMPTFNDLFYTDIGNLLLEPENTRQYNIGVQYANSFTHGMIRHWDLQADGYWNRVTDKIIAVPKGNGMYRWMMMNVGNVEIKGIDLAASAVSLLHEEWFLNLKLHYTWQQAQDLTRRTNKELEKITYGGQIAYIPWHSGSVVAGLNHRQWHLHYSFIYVGERYRSSANIRENYEQPWYTSDLSLTRSFIREQVNGKLSLEVNNLFSQDYEVVLNYPMPKRNYRITLTVEI
ncbi:MAG: TonB-dependent receptor plug domain-containing protein [Proteiniphilum sp.]|nr:TonB-dependent receptor plug domain-containing protein [Proteiniphilum sp.]